MTASAFVVTIDGSVEGRGLRNGVDTAVVWANDATDAKAIAEATFAYDQPAVWANATATAVAAATNMLGWHLHVKVTDNATGLAVVDVTVVGAGSDDTIDEIAALAVTALNATAPIAGAAYNSSTQVLKVAETTDGLGDNFLTVEWYPAGAAQNVAIPGFLVSKVDGGAAGDALTATFPADAYTVPAVIAKFARS